MLCVRPNTLRMCIHMHTLSISACIFPAYAVCITELKTDIIPLKTKPQPWTLRAGHGLRRGAPRRTPPPPSSKKARGAQHCSGPLVLEISAWKHLIGTNIRIAPSSSCLGLLAFYLKVESARLNWSLWDTSRPISREPMVRRYN